MPEEPSTRFPAAPRFDPTSIPGPRWLSTALGLGLLGDLLARQGPPGLGLALWTAALVLAAVLHRHRPARPPFRDLAIAALALAAVAGFVLRASPALHLLVALLLLAAGAALLLSEPGRSGVLAWAGAAVATGIGASVLALAGIVKSARPAANAGDRRRLSRALASAARGALLASPLLLVFGALFVSADPLFERYAHVVLETGLDEVISHATFAGVFAWFVGGLLVGLRGVSIPDPRLGGGPFRGWALELLVALLLVDLLFLAFIGVQARALFGGRDFVEATAGLTYAEYARRGFFQLGAAAAIALPTALALDWLIPRDRPRRRAFLVLAGLLVILVLLVLASAAHRMATYLEAYGLTEARLYGSAFMAWIAVACVLFGATVLRGRREPFVAGTVVAAWAVVLGMVAANPGGLVVRVNAARADAAGRFDADYAASLGADAVPALVAAFERVDPQRRCAVAGRLLDRWADAPPPDWRAWNLARWRARRAVERRAPALRAALAACPPAARSPALRPWGATRLTGRVPGQLGVVEPVEPADPVP